MLKKILRGIDKLNEYVGKAVSFLLIVIIFATFYEVVMRYFFKNPTKWSNELCAMLFGIYVVLTGGYLLVRKAHVIMDIFSSKFSPKTKAIVDICTYAFTFIFLVVMIWKGGERALQTIRLNEHSTSVWAPTMIPTRLALPVGGVLFLLQSLAEFIRNVMFLVKGETDL